MEKFIRRWLKWLACWSLIIFFLCTVNYLNRLNGKPLQFGFRDCPKNDANGLLYAMLMFSVIFVVSIVGSGVKRLDLKTALVFFFVLSMALTLPPEWIFFFMGVSMLTTIIGTAILD